VNAVMNLRVPSNSGNFLTSGKPVSFSKRTILHGVSKQVRSAFTYINFSKFQPVVFALPIVN
jgi:hypothetical protein